MTQRMTSNEPATGKKLWEGETGDVATEVERARAGWPLWAALPMANRIETMRRFANATLTDEAPLAELIARETGKPLWEAKGEIAILLAGIDTTIAMASERAGQRRLEAAMGARQAVRHKPRGVIGIITPCCMPAQIPVTQIIPALISGNAVVWKPSEHAPATAEAVVTLFYRAGVPDDALRLVQGTAETGADLARAEGVDGVFFTGTTRNGVAVHQALAAHPERLLALHMGGNNPLVVWDTPDLPGAANIVVQSAFTLSGQNCTNARRLIVKDELAEPLMAEVRKLLDRLIIDEPLAESAPFMGPLRDNRSADAVTEAALALMSKGGRPIRHPRRPKGDLPFLTPAIVDVTDVRERTDSEIFGPLLQMVRVATLEEALAQANATRFGLSAALVGGSPEHYDRFWSSVRAGIVNWNRPTTMVASAAPIGAQGLSGNGRASGAYWVDSCAYPVASAEMEQPRAMIGIGLAPIDTSAMGD